MKHNEERNDKMSDFKYFRRNKIVEEYPISTHVLQIKVDDIRPNRAQPRSDFDNNSIIRLADSIRRYGIIQPLTVRKADFDDIYAYELVAGERRLRAARMLGYFTVPCIVVEADENTSAELAIIENLLRKDLNFFEQAYGFKKLIENHGLTQEEVARRMSMSQSAVANKLRLLKLSDVEQRIILEGELSERHARALLKIDSQAKRIEVINYILSFGLNVANTEEYIDSFLKKSVEKKTPPPESSGETREKRMMQFVTGVQKKIESLNKQGKSASVEVTDSDSSIELHISIRK